MRAISRKAYARFCVWCISSVFTFSALALSQPPKPEKKLHTLIMHGDQRVDPYFWLQERENSAVIAHLEAENAYTKAMLAGGKTFEEHLLKEFQSRIPKVDETAPYRQGNFYYYKRTLAEQNYPVFFRRQGSMQGKEELLLDVNELAQGHKFFDVKDIALSPDDKYLAYAADTQGRRIYNIYVIERLSRKPVLTLEKVTPNFVWAEDSKTILFSRQDLKTLRWHKVYRRSLAEKKDVLVYEEKDTSFEVSVSKSQTNQYIFIQAGSTLTSEWQYIPANKPELKPKVFYARERGLEYALADGEDRFYILTNLNAPNFQIMESPKDKTQRASWKTVLEPNADTYRSGLDVFKTHLVIKERRRGHDIIRVIDRKTRQSRTVSFPEEAYVAGPYINNDYSAEVYLYSYQSLVTPPMVLSYNLSNNQQTVIKRQEVPGGFNPNLYNTERLFVKARDGVQIPMSIVYKKGLQKTGQNPALVYGYGSYGITIDPQFSAPRISLLDRGFIFAIAHVRGGGMLGRSWYEQGKLLHKKNTFNDFIDCSQALVDQKYTSSPHLYAMGRSAGGLLMGAVANQRPDLFHGIVAQVPFVDVITTMLDESIPLTTGEYDEWGDPRKKIYYDYMKSYSPYDNVKEQMYPNMLVTGGFHDSQVQYWEPAKWVAKLRDFNRSQNMILLHTNMDAGHGGSSGRLEALAEMAKDWSFILMLEGRRPATPPL